MKNYRLLQDIRSHFLKKINDTVIDKYNSSKRYNNSGCKMISFVPINYPLAVR